MRNARESDDSAPIELAAESDLADVFLIIRECSDWLAERGMSHWEGYYDEERILMNLRSDDFDTYIIRGEEQIATITLATRPPGYYTENEEHINHMAKFSESEPGVEALYVTGLGVRPKFQGKGYAKQLMNFAEEHARTRGIKYVRLDVRGDYLELVRFYEQLGYTKVGEMPDPDSPYYLFEKEIV